MKLYKHKNGFEYSAPATLAEFRNKCGITPVTYCPWDIPDIHKTKPTDVETIQNASRAQIAGEVYQMGPVKTYAKVNKSVNSYNNPMVLNTYLCFTVEGDSTVYGVKNNNIHSRNHKLSVRDLEPKAFDIGQISEYANSPVEATYSGNKDTQQLLTPGGVKYGRGYTQVTLKAGPSSPAKIIAAQKAVDTFNHHAHIMKNVWSSSASRLQRESEKTIAEAQGLTVSELKNKRVYENKIREHVNRTKKTMAVLPELIEAKNALEDFISKLTNDEVFEPKIAADTQAIIRNAADTISKLRNLGKVTL